MLGLPGLGQSRVDHLTIKAVGKLFIGRPLISSITTDVAPDTWVAGGGEGVIVAYAANRCLVVRQQQEVHEALQKYLVKLREER